MKQWESKSMLTVTNCQNEIEPVFANPGVGKKHLLCALDSGDRQVFLLALYDVMDAILEELESENNYCPLD